MKLVMCCTLVPAKYEVENRYISNAANRFLNNLYLELKKEHEISVLSYVGVEFSEDSRKELESQTQSDIRYFFKNNGIVKAVFKMIGETWKSLKTCDYAFTYNVVYAWMLTPILSKIRGKKSVLILADHSPVESYSSIKRKVYAKIQQWFMGQYDYIIGLSENTKKYLKMNQKFVCMEGGISEEFYNYFDKQKKVDKNEITIMYSGVLEKVTGIDLLLEAFQKMQMSNARLVITGDGTLAPWIMEQANEHSNIFYLGCMPYDQYIKKLMEADMLINPRNMNLPENENNFPSKIMEYLATGKLIVSTKFPGWERYQNVIDFCDSNPESIKETIEKNALDIGDLEKENYNQNRKYAERFLWKKQVKRLVDFIENEKV